MKTDDYKQELHISATLHSTNAKKIFLRSKKPRIAAKVFYDFFQSCWGDHKSIGAPSCVRKNGPSLKGPLGFTMKIFFSGRLWQ
jgi:hypothetical protein